MTMKLMVISMMPIVQFSKSKSTNLMKKENFFGNGLAEISFSEEKRLAPFIFKLQKGLHHHLCGFYSY